MKVIRKNDKTFIAIFYVMYIRYVSATDRSHENSQQPLGDTTLPQLIIKSIDDFSRIWAPTPIGTVLDNF
ncbi:MAG: hypothetical protein CVU12_03370 [Bacteroidetes bacterium HGW-Bacteroidetes-7]|nr:MAG: hypothetical protein CVU12_03370 [Bacteroidetes bacterium HGW-Bacteroidetes-7]